jgi:uncharacterized membrane protein YgaE (UPF0421/DUF939 family)
MKLTTIYTLKVVIGATLAIFIAYLFQLEFFITAGIIVILSIQNTKRESIEIAFKRLIATFIALLIAPILFNLFHFHLLSFGLFLALFIPLTIYFKLQDGITVNAVLVTHLLTAQNTSFNMIVNEIALMLIGVTTALVVNLYAPNFESRIKESIKEIETCMCEIYHLMVPSLKNQTVSTKEEQLFIKLDQELAIAKNRAYQYTNNQLLNKETFYLSYINMRKQQFAVLRRMREHFSKLTMSYEVTHIIADFTNQLAHNINIKNKADRLLILLNELRLNFKSMALPKTREEFENRALLYQFLNDIEHFLMIKIDFHKAVNYNEKLTSDYLD